MHDLEETEAMTGGSFEEFYTGAVSRLLGQLFLVTGICLRPREVVQEAIARASVGWSWLEDYNAPEAGLGPASGDEPGRRSGS